MPIQYNHLLPTPFSYNKGWQPDDFYFLIVKKILFIVIEWSSNFARWVDLHLYSFWYSFHNLQFITNRETFCQTRSRARTQPRATMPHRPIQGTITAVGGAYTQPRKPQRARHTYRWVLQAEKMAEQWQITGIAKMFNNWPILTIFFFVLFVFMSYNSDSYQNCISV